MSILDSKIQIWNSWSQLLEDKKKVEQDLFIAQENIEKVKVGENLFEKYIKLTSTTGKIYEEIMNRLSKEFSDNQVKYEVVTYNFRKKDHLDLASYYNKSGQWVSYNSASSGQKTILDVNFLSKIVTRLGILVMDEFLKSLDPENHDVCIEEILKLILAETFNLTSDLNAHNLAGLLSRHTTINHGIHLVDLL